MLAESRIRAVWGHIFGKYFNLWAIFWPRVITLAAISLDVVLTKVSLRCVAVGFGWDHIRRNTPCGALSLGCLSACSLPHQPSSSLGETMSRAQNSTASLKCSARKLTANSSCRSSNAATGRGPTCLPPTAWVVSLVPANSPPELAQGPWPPTMTASTRGVNSPLLETAARAAGMNSRRALTTRSRQPLLVSARVATGSAITTATA